MPFFSAIVERPQSFTAVFLPSRLYCFSVTNRTNLFSRISPLREPSVRVVPVLEKWIEEEDNAVNSFHLQRIIKTLRSQKRFTQALQISEWMSSKGICTITPSDQALLIDLIGKVRGAYSAESYFQNLSDGYKTWKLHGALLNCYVREGLVDKSLSQFQKMKDLGFVSNLNYNNIMCLFMQTGQHEKVPGVLAMMTKEGVAPNIFSYRICISSYGARSDLVNVEKLLEEMESEPHIGTDWTTYAMVANFYIKAGMEEKALMYLLKCEVKADKRNTIAYNHLISHYASLGRKQAMMRLWKLQKDNCKKQLNREYITMLGCLVKLGDLDQAQEVLGEWELSGNTYDFRVPNILLIGYSQRGLMDKAEMLLQNMIEKGKTPIPNSWAIIASGYVNKDNMEKAFQSITEALAVQAENKVWKPKVSLISTILSWATENIDVSEVEDFVNSLRTVVSLNRDMYLSLIKMYVRCGMDVEGILESMKGDNIELDEEIKEMTESRLQ